MYQIEQFQKWLKFQPKDSWGLSPFWPWITKNYNIVWHEDNKYKMFGSDFVFRLTKQEEYIKNFLDTLHYPLTNEQIIKLMNAPIVISKYEYN